jgi:hypothetical protein
MILSELVLIIPCDKCVYSDTKQLGENAAREKSCM